jgi:DHA1 family multidrug resistance protein-like MFS transporter
VRGRGSAASTWQVMLALFFITSVVESGSFSQVSAFLPVYLQGMRVPHVAVWVGLLASESSLVGLPIVPLWGVWARRYGAKAVIVRSAVVEVVVLGLLSVSHSLPSVAVALALVGLQLGNTGVMLSALRRVVPGNRVGFAVSLFSGASPVGMALGPFLGGWVADATPVGLHGLFRIDAALSVGTAAMLTLLYRESPRPEGAGAGTDRAAATPVWREAYASVRAIFALPVVRRLFALYAVLMLGRQMLRPFLPLVIAPLSPSPAQVALVIGVLLGLAALTGAGISVVAGRLGDRVGFVRVLAGGMAAVALLTPPLGLIRQLAPFGADLIGYTAAMQIGTAMVFALLATEVPEPHRATALNLVYLPRYVTGIVGPGIVSAMAPLGLVTAFSVAGAVVALGAVAAAGPRARPAGAGAA